eukprot:gene4493-14649_t
MKTERNELCKSARTVAAGKENWKRDWEVAWSWKFGPGLPVPAWHEDCLPCPSLAGGLNRSRGVQINLSPKRLKERNSKEKLPSVIMDVDSDCYSMENSPSPSPSPSPAAKTKGKAAAKPKAGKPLAPSQAHNVPSEGLHAGKAIEEIYQKKSQLEHILLRPDTYIGSTEKQQQQMWVHDGSRMVQSTISFVPGLYKIFDEILVNAADNRVRDPSMDTVKVTGGRNGYGAKLANIFSTEFVIETCDGKRQRRYRQVFRNNMSEKLPPKISACKPTDNWTCVTFKPDLAKFGMEELETDSVSLMRKRVYDLAGIMPKGCKVYLDGIRLPVKSFSDYVDLYLGPKEAGVVRVYERINERWEVCVSATDGQHNQVSFVNSICTSKGGTHVNYVVDQLTKSLVEKINKKNKNANVKGFMVKNHLWVFVNANIENPAFDSQTKENLTLRASSFGSKCDLTGSFADKVAKCGVVESILSFATFKNNKELKKSDGTKRARLVGGGKLLNVREASAAQISGNVEIQNIKQILGLQHGKVYEDVKSLRYGHLMIMTDQDHDGSHIKGLIMNFLHSFFPSLLKLPNFLLEFITPIVKLPDFLLEFITPIVKATRGNRVMTFYTLPEYEAWQETLPSNSTKGWAIKYYKGLGTSTPKEAKEYFASLESHRKEFIWSAKQINYSDFINKELILFSRADLERSIPCMVDGLKPGQRKILYSCFKRNLKSDIKGGKDTASAHYIYTRLTTLVHPNSNCSPMTLLPFPCACQGGKDAASARYIYTRLTTLSRHLFNENDDRLLEYLNEEGQSIEPKWCALDARRGLGLNGPMLGETKLEITELPVRKWTQDYKEYLEGLIKPEDKNEAPTVVDYHEHHTDATVHFTIDVVSAPKMAELAATGFETKFKLSTKFSTGNMMLFNAEGLIKHYSSPEQVIEEFYHMRLDYYEKRRQAMLKAVQHDLSRLSNRMRFFKVAAQHDLSRLSNRVRFIKAVISGTLKINNRKKKDIEADLAAQGFDKMASAKAKTKAASSGAAEIEGGGDDAEEAAATAAANASYDYLLSMPIYSLTLEKVDSLLGDMAGQEEIVTDLRTTTAKRMWAIDLDAFMAAYDEWEAEEEAELERLAKQQRAVRKGGKDDDEFEVSAPKAKKAGGGARKAPAASKPPPARSTVGAAPKGGSSSTASMATASAAVASMAATSSMQGAAAPSAATVPRPTASETVSVGGSEPVGLLDRLAGRFQKLKVVPAASGGAVPSAASKDSGGASAGGAAASHPTISMSHVGLDINEAMSPAPQIAAKTAARRAPAGKAAAAAAAGKVTKPPAEKAGAKGSGGAAAAGGAKRKPRGKRVVSSSDEGSDTAGDSDAASDAVADDSDEVYDMEAPSPAVAPKGKKSKIGTTPIAMKRSISKTGAASAAVAAPAAVAVAAPKPKAAAVSKAKPPPAASPEASGDESEVEEVAPRARVARRAAAPTSYIEIKDSDEEDVISDDDGDDDSFSADDEDD